MEGRGLIRRKLVVLTAGTTRAAVASALARTELKLVVASEFGGTVPGAIRDRADAVLFDRLDVLLVARPSAEVSTALASLDTEGRLVSVEDEGFVYAVGAPRVAFAQSEHLRGYRDGAQGLVEHLTGETAPGRGALRAGARTAAPGQGGGEHETFASSPSARSACSRLREEPSNALSLSCGPAATAFAGVDESEVTWGIQAIGASRSSFTGRGVKVAVLDTGYDKGHRDFEGRRVVSKSILDGEDVRDWHGHGMHTAGILSGPVSPSLGPRYGVASEAELHVCKVLDSCGVGRDGDLLDGINWALENGCRVISMSLGVATERPLTWYDVVGRRALEQGALIVAAAGNDSRRSQGTIKKTYSPANSEIILAVAALDASLEVAEFSNGGKIDIAAPGVQIYSSYHCGGYKCLSGTSMATPYVAGVAALFMQANPDKSAQQIRELLLNSARALRAPRADVGVGLVQAP